MTLFVVLAVIVIAVLASYAFYLFLKLREQNSRREQQRQQLAEEQKERQEHYRNSIRVIASAILAEQVTLTEAAIRISMLVSQLELSASQKEDYTVFFQLTEATSHIPILEEWKKLNSLEKQRYDQERETLERSYKEFMEHAAQKILDNNEGSNAKPLFYSVGEN